MPGLKLEDDRVIRLLEVLLHPDTFVADWTSREVHARVLSLHRLTEAAYRLGQLRYDLGKLRAHGLAERIGSSRRHRLTSSGRRLGVLLVKLRTRLLGPWPARPPSTRRVGLPATPVPWKPPSARPTSPSTTSAPHSASATRRERNPRESPWKESTASLLTRSRWADLDPGHSGPAVTVAVPSHPRRRNSQVTL